MDYNVAKINHLTHLQRRMNMQNNPYPPDLDQYFGNNAPVQPPILQPYQQPEQTPVVSRPFFGTDRKTIVFALILLCLSVLCTNSFLFGQRPGLGASIFTVALFFTLAAYLYNKKKTVTFYGVFACAAYLAFALSFCLTGNRDAILLVIPAMFVLSGVIYMEFMKQRRYNGFRSVGDFCRTSFVLTFGRIHYGVFALFHKDAPDGTLQKRKSGGVLLGIAIAVPFLLIIIPLLIKSDAAFENLLSKLTFSTIIEIAISVAFGGLLFLLLLGRALCIPREEQEPAEVQTGRGMESVIVISFLSMISAVYVVYLLSQFAYFFNGFAGILPGGYSVAEYARRGFFEMSIICAINLLIVFLANLICRKKDGRTPRAVTILSLFLCIFSLLLAATVLSKIGLYIHSFGMTHLRILTFLFTILLFVVFISVSIRLFNKKVPYMKIALVTATLLLLFAVFADTDRLVAAYNIRAYQSGKLDSIDMDTISELDSHAVVPYVMDLIDDPDYYVVIKAKDILSAHADSLILIQYTESGKSFGRDTDWRSWNLAEQEAVELLEKEFNNYYTSSYRYR